MSANLKETNHKKKVTEGIMVVGRSTPVNTGPALHFTRAKFSGVLNLFVFIFDLLIPLSYEQDNQQHNEAQEKGGAALLSQQ